MMADNSSSEGLGFGDDLFKEPANEVTEGTGSDLFTNPANNLFQKPAKTEDAPKFILLVTSDSLIIATVKPVLKSLGYRVFLPTTGKETIERAKEASPEVIFIDLALATVDCCQTIKDMKTDEKAKTIPVIVMAGSGEFDLRARALEAGADEVITKPVDSVELQTRLKSSLKIRAFYENALHPQGEIEAEINRRIEQFKKTVEKLKAASLDTIFRLARAAEFKDEDTGAHIERMSHYSTAIARKMGLDEERIEYLLYAAPMHDIGKIGIPDAVLKKPGKLNDEEWKIMRQHTVFGAAILKGSKVEFIKLAEDIALTHHEKWNGTGYPRGLKGTETILEGRIVAMADVFDALTSERPYKKPMPLEKSLSIIMEGKGTHFDPDVVDAFIGIKDEIESSLNWWKFLNTGCGETGPPANPQ
jgi:putative two-component system response regulator